MNPVEVVSNALFYRVVDGRIVFRPWGPKGPCYLLTESQRFVRSWIQLIYICVLPAIIVFDVVDITNIRAFGLAALAWALGNYVLFWFYSFGLSRTEPPAKPTREYTDSQLRQSNRSWGKLLPWVLFTLSSILAMLGVAIGVLGGPIDTSIETAVFFGLCAMVFLWILKKP